MDASIGRRQKRISRQQEKRAAEDVGGRPTPASGAMPGLGADVRKLGELRIECKYTEKESYRLELAILEKLRVQAISGGLEYPVLQLGFRTPNGKMDQFAIIQWDHRLERPAVAIYSPVKSILISHHQLRLCLVDDAKFKVTILDSHFEILRWEEFSRKFVGGA